MHEQDITHPASAVSFSQYVAATTSSLNVGDWGSSPSCRRTVFPSSMLSIAFTRLLNCSFSITVYFSDPMWKKWLIHLKYIYSLVSVKCFFFFPTAFSKTKPGWINDYKVNESRFPCSHDWGIAIDYIFMIINWRCHRICFIPSKTKIKGFLINQSKCHFIFVILVNFKTKAHPYLQQ